MKIVAFDLGSHMAVAHNCHADVTAYSLNLASLKDRRDRAMKTMHWLNGIFRALKPLGLECVIYERPFARGMAATRALWGLAGLIEGCAKSAGFDALDVTPATIKAWATGNGHASKDEMIEAAQGMGYTGEDEHEADAHCLLCYGAANVVTERDGDDSGEG